MKLKVTAVSYLNTKPFLYGLFKSGLNEEIELRLDVPAEGARKLAKGEADMGLVPVAVIPQLPSPHIFSDYCIGAAGTVKTVGIFGHCPLNEMTHLYLDHHSRTSVELVKILMQKHWHHSPVLLQANPGFEDEIKGTTGALIIGDKAIGKDQQYPFVYDLGEAWMALTGLPFVFAAWVSNQPLDPSFIERFNAALQMGLDHIPQLMYILPAPVPGFDLQRYFTENISYQLDSDKKKALKMFLSMMDHPQHATFKAVGLEV